MFAATAPVGVEGDPPAYGGDHVGGEFDQVEMIDHHLRIRQQCVGDRRACAALDLPEQALIATQIDESGVPRAA